MPIPFNARFSLIKLNSSIEGRNQSLYPPSVLVSQRYAAILVSEHPEIISEVFCCPVPIAVPFAPINVPAHPH